MGRMGQPPLVVVSAHTVAELAKCALVPIRCETLVVANAERSRTKGSCAQELSCWKTFRKHQIKKHSGKRRAHNGGIIYVCRLNKCSAANHNSSDALKAHIELSHMKSVSLPCPFANCKPTIPSFGRPTQYNMFIKEKDLVAHLESHHADLIGCELDLRDKRLLPSWQPRPPLNPSPPPDLPLGVIPTATFRLEWLPPCIIRSPVWFERLEADAESVPVSSLALPPTPVPHPHTPKIPGGRHRLLRSPARLPSSPDPASPQAESQYDYDFDDLIVVRYDSDTGTLDPPEMLFAPYYVVQPSAERCEDVHALPMGEVPLRALPPPPASIFHEALKKQVFAQYALGESAATDSLALDGRPAISLSTTPTPA
ncbi:hypothetical protein B0H17DRAFT_1100748 [Mycena rosella]|uniref:C2H2-type domain-containing protein n=1 Tax=Mycena rosella TaxID=1033263 RepID=A0AAD7G0M2_MYCRO|nr:hypothetical protein B0H17DRAFT_1100748 [Mycena rosella]